MTKHILYICRYFPPEITGGARRAVSLVREFRELGYKVTIAAPKGIDDDEVISAAHPIYPAEINNFNKDSLFQNFLSWLRINILLPDPEIRWALRLYREIIKSNINPDYIICSGPPESLFVIGYLLKLKIKAKLIADMRDPWIAPPQRQILINNPLRIWIEKKIAKYVFKKFDAIVAVSDFVLQDGLNFAPLKIKSKIIGHFAEDYLGEKYDFPSEFFNIVHTGAISLSNPLTQFDEFFSEFELIAKKRKDLKLWIAGNLSGYEISRIKSSKISSQIEIIGAVSMEQARKFQKGADALLIVSGSNSHAMPGKFAEYSFTEKPIILSRKGKWCSLLPPARYYEMQDLLTLSKNTFEKYPHQSAKAAAKLYSLFLNEV